MTAFHSESTHEMPSGTRPAVVAAVSTTTSPSTVTRTPDPDSVAPCKASNSVRGQHRGTPQALGNVPRQWRWNYLPGKSRPPVCLRWSSAVSPLDTGDCRLHYRLWSL